MSLLLLLMLTQDPVDVIRKAVDRGGGYESAYKSLVSLGAAGLAASFKAAVYCGACANGKVKCPDCEGRGRRDLPCARCGGAGRHAPEGGVVGDVEVSVKCRNCDGLKVFRNAGCPTCARSGQAACGACLGSPWRDRHCALKECRQGKVPCPECRGKGKVQPVCAVCSGERRTQAPGAANGASVSVKCRGCDGKGVASAEQPCTTCAGNPEGLGKVRCAGRGFRPKVEACPPCADCSRSGLKILAP
jgi:DnaJ-class molecular chaperone